MFVAQCIRKPHTLAFQVTIDQHLDIKLRLYKVEKSHVVLAEVKNFFQSEFAGRETGWKKLKGGPGPHTKQVRGRLASPSLISFLRGRFVTLDCFTGLLITLCYLKTSDTGLWKED